MEQENLNPHQLDNQKALDKFMGSYPNAKNLEDAMHDSPGEKINTLRMYGLSCSKCGGFITEANLAFFNYNVLAVKCIGCQYGKEQ